MIDPKYTKVNFWVRVSVFWFFCVEGTYNGVFSAYLPEVQDRLNISDNVLGGVVLLNYLGQVLATPGAGGVMRKWGSKTATFSAGFLFATSLPLLATTPTVFALCIVLLWYGLTQGFMDCSMNSSGILTEAVAGYPVLAAYHGSYSIAAAAGGFIATAMSAAGWPEINVYSITAGICTTCTIVAGMTLYGLEDEKAILSSVQQEEEHEEKRRQQNTKRLIDSSSDITSQGLLVPVPSMYQDPDDSFNGYDQTYEGFGLTSHTMSGGGDSGDNNHISALLKEEAAKKAGRFWWLSSLFMLPRTWPLIYLSMLGFFAAFVETALTTFLMIYYKRYFADAPSNTISVGFVCFEVCMGCGRFSTDKLRSLLGSQRLAQIGGILACVGIGLLCISPSLTPAAGSSSFSADIILSSFGMCLTGAGISTLIPVTFAVAGYIGHSGTSLATVGCWMYIGGVISSPIMGLVSDGFDSLRDAMIFLACFCMLIVPLGFVIPKDRYTGKEAGRHGGVSGGGSEDGKVALFDDDELSAPLIV